MSYQIVDMMRGVVDDGSGRVIRRLGFDLPAAGKTGTTNSYQDAWFIGFTPTLSTSVWVGFDKNRPLRDRNGVGVTGGRGAAPIWARFMKQAMEGEPARDFTVPEDIHLETIDPQTGRAPDALSRETLQVALTDGQSASGVVIESRPEGLFASPPPAASSPSALPEQGIIEEDLPKDN